MELQWVKRSVRLLVSQREPQSESRWEKQLELPWVMQWV